MRPRLLLAGLWLLASTGVLAQTPILPLDGASPIALTLAVFRGE